MIKYFRRIYKDKVETSIKTITDYIDQLEADNERLQERIASFNKDDEIQKYKDQSIKNASRSLLRLSDKENLDIAEFKNYHWIKCKNSGDYEYRLTGTGVGTIITIKCPICMSAKNVTDDSSW